jgi:3-oxoacyl-[acyl-carrier-protein] synthase II
MSAVVVTGVGLVTSIGVGAGASWTAMLEGREGVGEIPYFDTTAYKVHRAHVIREVPLETTPHELACMAASEAVQDAGLDVGRVGAERVGVVVGTLGGDLKTFEGALRAAPRCKENGFTPAVARTYPLATILTVLAERLGTGGPHLASVNACSSGNHALAAGCDLVRRGEAEAMIVGGVDVLAQTEFTYFHNLRSLAAEHCQPFDRNRRGLMIGEGAGMLVVEPLERAAKRGARVYAEVKGYGLSADGFHVTSPDPSGAGAIRAMQAALRAAALSPDDIDYVSAHGTGTPANDRAEAVALRTVLGERAGRVPVSSVKSMIGHTMGAASAIESVVCCLALRDGIVPPTINYERPDPDCPIDCVPNAARPLALRAVMNNSFAFGGNNAVVVFTGV